MVKKLISIIVPVYNVAAYLEVCLHSICHQLESDVELIIVNDGSTDRSAEIIRFFAQKFVTIHVLTQNNLGLSSARNAGLDVAIGRYVWFVDGDDFVVENALDSLKNILRQHPDVDMLRFGYFQFSDESGAILKSFHPTDAGPLSANLYFNSHEMMHEACMGLYRRDYLSANHIRFAEDLIFEDTIFNVQAYSAGGSLFVRSLQLYWYRMRPGSLSRSDTSIKKIQSIIYLLKICDKIIDSNKRNIPAVGFVADKKLDFINLLIDHLFCFDEYSSAQKWAVFQKVNPRIPVLSKNRFGIKVMKIFLRFVSKLYFTVRWISLKKGWTLPNI